MIGSFNDFRRTWKLVCMKPEPPFLNLNISSGDEPYTCSISKVSVCNQETKKRPTAEPSMNAVFSLICSRWKPVEPHTGVARAIARQANWPNLHQRDGQSRCLQGPTEPGVIAERLYVGAVERVERAAAALGAGYVEYSKNKLLYVLGMGKVRRTWSCRAR